MMELRHPKYNEFQRKLEEQEKARQQKQQQPTQQLSPQQKMKVAVSAFLPQIPASMSARTYQVKQKTGRHCTEVALQKYARELFELKYKIAFTLLPVQYQSEITSMVSDAYYGMKEARSYE